MSGDSGRPTQAACNVRVDSLHVHNRPPPRPTVAAALVLGMMCMALVLTGSRSWDLRQWTIMLAAVGVAIGGVAAVRRLERRHGVERWEAMWRHRRAPAYMYLTMALVMLLFMVTMTSRSGGSVLVRLISMPGNVGMFLGMAVGAVGVVRISAGRYCRKCRYEMSDAIAADPACERCPECGWLWRGPGGTVGGRVIYRWPWIAAGIVVGVSPMLWTMFTLSRPGLRSATLQVLPTSSLMEEVASGFMPADSWDVLMTRQLSPAQEEYFARRLLEGRSRRGYIATVADDWIHARAVDGLLPPDFARRYVEEHPHPHILEARKYLAAPPAPAAPATEPGAP